MTVSNALSNKSSGLTDYSTGKEPATDQTTSQNGNSVTYNSSNYTIEVTKQNQQVLIKDKKTGEEFKAWGDPHTTVNGRRTGDFKNDLTVILNDGTKVTLQTTAKGDKTAESFVQNVVISNGDYGVAITGVKDGDMKFKQGNGDELDGIAADGNIIYQTGNETNSLKGFHGMVNSQLETIDTSEEYTAMEIDDDQIANSKTHTTITNFIKNGGPVGSSSAIEAAQYDPAKDMELQNLKSDLNELTSNVPQPINPKVAAAAKEAERQGKEAIAAANEIIEQTKPGQVADPKKVEESNKKLQQAQDEYAASMAQLHQAAMDAAEGSDSTSSGSCNGKSWYMALAKAMGKSANAGAAEIEKLTKKMTGASKDDKPDIQIELQAASQRFSYMMSAINNALTTIGQASTGMVRKT